MNINEAQEYNAQGKLLADSQNFSEAIKYYKKAEAADPSYIQTYFNMGEAYVMLDDYELAKSAFSKVLLIDKENGEAYFHLGNIAMLTDSFEDGRMYYSKAVVNGYDQPQVYVNLSTMYEQIGDINSAISSLTKAISRDKFRADAKLRKCELFMFQNKNAEALQAIESLIETNPDLFEGYHYKFSILMEMERFDEAKAVLDYAEKTFTNDDGFTFDRVKYYSLTEKYNDALNTVEKLIDKFEDRKEELPTAVLLEKSRILLSVDKVDESIEILEGIEDDSCIQDVCFYLENIYASKNMYDKVLEVSNRAIEHKDDSIFYYNAIYYRALSLKNLGRKDEAKKAFESAVDELKFACMENSSLIDLYTLRALCYKDLKQYDKALEMADYITAVSDEIGEAYLIRSEIYKETNEPEKSEKERQIAMSKSNIIGQLLS